MTKMSISSVDCEIINIIKNMHDQRIQSSIGNTIYKVSLMLIESSDEYKEMVTTVHDKLDYVSEAVSNFYDELLHYY